MGVLIDLFKGIKKVYSKNNKCPKCGGILEKIEHRRKITPEDHEFFMSHSGSSRQIVDGWDITYTFKCKECAADFSFDEIINNDESEELK